MASIGDILTSPESGWKRYESIDDRFTINGAFYYYQQSGLSDGSGHNIGKGTSAQDINSSFIKFKFEGNKIRLISSRYYEYSKNMSMNIDGVEYKGTAYASGSSATRQVIICEATDLSYSVHTVVIRCLDEIRYDFNAIDINDDGFLHYETYQEGYVSKGNSSLSYILPMSSINKINSKISDDREGLLGMANNDKNYGELYVVGNDGKSHLTKAGLTSEILLDGDITESTDLTFSKSLDNYNFIAIRYNLIYEDGVVDYGYTLVKLDKDYKVDVTFLSNVYTRFIKIDDKTIRVEMVNGEARNRITEIIGIY